MDTQRTRAESAEARVKELKAQVESLSADVNAKPERPKPINLKAESVEAVMVSGTRSELETRALSEGLDIRFAKTKTDAATVIAEAILDATKQVDGESTGT